MRRKPLASDQSSRYSAPQSSSGSRNTSGPSRTSRFMAGPAEPPYHSGRPVPEAQSEGAPRWSGPSPPLSPAADLALGRCIGEYGSVIFIAGNKPYETEITPLIIMSELQDFDYNSATAIALVMLAFSFAILFIVNLIQARNTKILKGGR